MNRSIWTHRLSNYGCGLLAAGTTLALRGAGVAVYGAGYEAGGKWIAGFGIAQVALTFLLIDILYYVQHRLEHRMGPLWAIHSVHHQSEICDASVSLRVPMLASLAVGLFHLPLSFVGIEPLTYVVAYLLHTGVVVLFHSRTPRWLDRAGWVFNSPYLHRLHHASNPELVDKNFGGVLVVWDRLFGTFQAKHEGPLVFGVDGAATPLNPLAANLAPWRQIFTSRQRAH